MRIVLKPLLQCHGPTFCGTRPPYLNLHISVSSLPQFGQSNVQSSWSGLSRVGLIRASIIRVPQRGQSGLLIESEYGVLGL